MKPSYHLLASVRLGTTAFKASHRPSLLPSPFTSQLLTSHASLPRRRSFHIGPYIQTSTQIAQDVFVSVHNVTGLSWALTIPLVALGVNLLFRFPFNYHTQILLQRRSKLTPLLQGWFQKLWSEALRDKVPPQRMKKEVKKRVWKQTKRIHRSLGLQHWKAFYPLLGIPFWLISLEAIRRLCGWGRWDQLLGRDATNGATAGTSAAEAGNALTAGPELSRDLANTASDLSSPAFNPGAVSELANGASQLGSAPPNLDSTLTIEGILWFTDLTVADPYYILPMTWIGLTVVNLMPKDEAARRALFGRLYPYMSRKTAASSEVEPAGPPSTETVQMESSGRVKIIRALTVASPLLICYVGDFPAAMHLYTVSSVAATMAFRSILSRRYPLQAKTETCKHREMYVVRPALPKKDDTSASVTAAKE